MLGIIICFNKQIAKERFFIINKIVNAVLATHENSDFEFDPTVRNLSITKLTARMKQCSLTTLYLKS